MSPVLIYSKGKCESGDSKEKVKRSVCDHCRRRRIRCDGSSPCEQCRNADLSCKREHVQKKRGPKRGTGRVIAELKADERGEESRTIEKSHANGGDFETGRVSSSNSIDEWMNNSSSSPNFPSWDCPVNSGDGSYMLSPASLENYFLIQTCLELFIQHIYPIMPLIHIPSFRNMLSTSNLDELTMSNKNLIYSLCALTSLHMSGKSISSISPTPLDNSNTVPTWETVGRYFLDQCIAVRQSYDFIEDLTLNAVISSYFVSTAYFEVNSSRKSWYYLRETLTMAEDISLHEESSYVGLDETEALCRRRMFWILFVTERSFAILRHKPLTLSRTPGFPQTVHSYEDPSIHAGFAHLVQTFSLLDESFVNSWNSSSSNSTSKSTYTTLQRRLASPILPISATSSSDPSIPDPSLNDIQRADILITQQWLRLIVWQSSMRQGLLSSTSPDPSMTFTYPLQITHTLLQIISSLPRLSIEVHGMGIFEKIFEIGCSMVDVVQASASSNIGAFSRYGNDFEVLGRAGSMSVDPFEVLVQMLSATPNSQKTFASLLLEKAAEKPEIKRYSLSGCLGLYEPGSDSSNQGDEIDVVQGYEAMTPRGYVTELLNEDIDGLATDLAWDGVVTGNDALGGLDSDHLIFSI